MTTATAVGYTGDVDWGLKNWEPSKHPRDRHGRFTGSITTDLSDAERDLARGVMKNFKPKKFSNGAEADKYLKDNAGTLSEDQRSAVDTYSGDAFLEINRDLRSGGEGPDGYKSTIKDLRAGMHPIPDDLILNRTVPADAFPKGALDALAGKKVKDAAFSSTALGVTYGLGLGNIQMKIAVPKGTPAIFVAPISRNPHEREILLPDGMEFAVASVTKSDEYGGYKVGLIVLPKSGSSTTDNAHHGHIRAAADDPPPPAEPEQPPPPADLSGHDADYIAALALLLALWIHIGIDQRNQVGKQIAQAIDAGNLAKLADLTVDSDLAATRLREELVAIHRKAAAQAVAEAAAQQATVAAAVPDEEHLGQVASVTADLLGRNLAVQAGREALRRQDGTKTGQQVATEVKTYLAEQSTAPVETAVGGALAGTQNRARIDTWRDGPIGSFYADEQLDSNTCAPCRAINGRFICTTEDFAIIDRLYTSLGGYVDCLGGLRCRGTVTGVWRPETVDGPAPSP